MSKQYLWDILKLDPNFKCDDVDIAYSKIENKNDEAKLAWKILRDEYYSEVYKKYLSIDTVIKAGFILDNLDLEDSNYYNLDLLTTPVSKLKNSQNNPVVLVTTGGFDPIHDGHIYMMEFAKEALEKEGYDVIGGYLSPSHESYVSTKPYNKINAFERLDLCQECVKDSQWLMIDPWESIYVKTYINFTDIITRLEQYLRKHVNPNVQVAYVFGGDNCEFMYCFENKGIGICVEREGHSEKFNEMKNKFKGKNNFFINNKSIVSTYSSRNIRKRQGYKYKNLNYSKEDGCYVIRNEGMITLEKYKNSIDSNKLENAHKKFLEKLIILLQNAFDNKLEIKTINMQEQLKKATDILEGKKTISLDTYYRGTYDIETSRLFDISDIQKKYISLIGRIGKDTIEEQIEKIKDGSYILVDDDSATGKTIREIMGNLPERINIEQIYLLASMLNEKIFDIVDLRDFIIGVQNGGLIVKMPNGDVARSPYVLPYVCLKSRATIPASKEMEISIKLWEMNKEFYQEIGGNIILQQTDNGFKKLMNYIGFDDNTSLVDICNWHIRKLKQE